MPVLGEANECSNSRGISLLSKISKLYGRALIRRVRATIEEEQCLGRVEGACTKCLL